MSEGPKSPRQVLEGAFDAGQLVRIELKDDRGSSDRSAVEGFVERFFRGRDSRDRVVLRVGETGEQRIPIDRIANVLVLVTVRPGKPSKDQRTRIRNSSDPQ